MSSLFSADRVLDVVAWAAIGMMSLALVLAVAAFWERTVIRARQRTANELKARWADPVWRVLFGRAPLKTVWSLVDDRHVLDFVAYLFPLIRRVDGSERLKLAEMVRPYLPRVRSELRRRSAGRRAMAVEALGYFGDPEDVPRLLAALDDRSPLVSMVAVRALAERQGSWENAATILHSLDRFGSWDPGFLATLLVELGPEACPALRQAFANPSTPLGIRIVTAIALKMLNDVEAADKAAEVLAVSADRDLRAAALRLLGQVGNERHVEVVADHLSSGDFVLRVAAVDAFATVSPKDDLHRLRNMVLDDSSQWVSIHAARGLRQAGQVRVLEEMAASGHPRRAVALQALMEGG